jgi:hypothetical protein
VIAGAAPVLSALLTVPPSRTAPSLRKSRHPTIPVRARELGSGTGESVFKPAEAGTVAWTFNDVTGVITRVCTVGAATSSSSLTAADLGPANCLSTTAQLLSGAVAFNLRGASRDVGSGTSVLKPVPGGSVAWSLDDSSRRVKRNCQVDASSTNATLSIDDVGGGHACVSVDQPISPFDAANDPAATLVAADSESPAWPVLPLSIALSLTSTGHAAAPVCFADSPTNSLLANQSGQTVIEYFCIVFPNVAKTWSGQSLVVPGAFVDGGPATWPVGTDTDQYRICRYSLGTTPVDNGDHPSSYVDASGNLINQNFLVIAGPKNCPSDVAANPSAGDLVDSNTLPHQPAS